MASTKPKHEPDKGAAELPASAKVDVVAVPSLKADGTPDQTPGFVTTAEDLDHAQSRQKSTQDSAEETEQAVKAVVRGDE
ncbi:hypothetical protein GXB85_04680 [Cellulomonas sp. APG4]|uniref:hypothetical protein n=1 Tax=Cellulomonas sp. APG4 TaxID=1538656 RepID=UPI001379E75B|nr:hypothetical protein [Cellulomonas sp. APG4]NCT90249.1 hypothetical protein [Cellulomonas sp. APG4]